MAGRGNPSCQHNMAKIDSILNLINLLSTRESVSLQNIMDTLRISRRSVFRYLNTISEANFPVYHDGELGGYRMTYKRKEYVPPLNLTDSILVLSCLMAMNEKLSDEYSAMISKIESRLLTSLNVPLEKIVPAYRREFSAVNDQESISRLITSLLVEVAITYGKGIKILRRSEPAITSELVVENPSIWFKGHWKIAQRKSVDVDNTILSTIERVIIL